MFIDQTQDEMFAQRDNVRENVVPENVPENVVPANGARKKKKHVVPENGARKNRCGARKWEGGNLATLTRFWYVFDSRMWCPKKRCGARKWEGGNLATLTRFWYVFDSRMWCPKMGR